MFVLQIQKLWVKRRVQDRKRVLLLALKSSSKIKSIAAVLCRKVKTKLRLSVSLVLSKPNEKGPLFVNAHKKFSHAWLAFVTQGISELCFGNRLQPNTEAIEKTFLKLMTVLKWPELLIREVECIGKYAFAVCLYRKLEFRQERRSNIIP